MQKKSFLPNLLANRNLAHCHEYNLQIHYPMRCRQPLRSKRGQSDFLTGQSFGGSQRFCLIVDAVGGAAGAKVPGGAGRGICREKVAGAAG